jgi:hypothetical protein
MNLSYAVEHEAFESKRPCSKARSNVVKPLSMRKDEKDMKLNEIMSIKSTPHFIASILILLAVLFSWIYVENILHEFLTSANVNTYLLSRLEPWIWRFLNGIKLLLSEDFSSFISMIYFHLISCGCIFVPK